MERHDLSHVRLFVEYGVYIGIALLLIVAAAWIASEVGTVADQIVAVIDRVLQQLVMRTSGR